MFPKPLAMNHYINKWGCLSFLCFSIACGSQQKEPTNSLTPQQIIDSVQEVTGVGKVVPSGGFYNLSSNSTGIVEDVFVQEGDSIARGQKLLRLKDEDQRFEAAQVRAQLASLEASHARLSADLAKEQLLLKEYEKNYQTSKVLYAQKAETTEKVATDERLWKQQEKAVQALLLDMEANALKEREIQLEVQNKQKKVNEREVLSPHEGILLDWLVEKGQQIDLNTLLGKVANPDSVQIKAEVDELFAHKVQVGQKVQLKYAGRPEVLGVGIVRYVSPALSEKSILYEVAGEGEDRRVRKLHIQPEEGATLLINAKVECLIQIK